MPVSAEPLLDRSQGGSENAAVATITNPAAVADATGR